MTVEDIYIKACKDHYSLKLVIEFLVKKRRVLKMTDSEEKLTYYLQEKYWNKMNEYLREWENEINHRT